MARRRTPPCGRRRVARGRRELAALGELREQLLRSDRPVRLHQQILHHRPVRAREPQEDPRAPVVVGRREVPIRVEREESLFRVEIRSPDDERLPVLLQPDEELAANLERRGAVGGRDLDLREAKPELRDVSPFEPANGQATLSLAASAR